MSKEHKKHKKDKKKGKKGKESDGVLYVQVIEAKNLAAMDKNGTSDPYAVVTSSFNKQKFKTSIIKKTLNPVWNEEFKFYTSRPKGHVVIKLWDKDKWSKDDFLGELMIPIENLANGQIFEDWFHVENEPQKGKKNNQPQGEVHVSLKFPIAASKNRVENNDSDNRVITDYYEFGDELGRGGFSIVKRGINKKNREEFAIKIIEKNQNQEEMELLQREIDIMQMLKHKNIIALEDVFEDDTHLYLVMELVTGGELFDQIMDRGIYSERDSANIIKQILEAVSYMHENGIAHRDLKPENLLVSGKNNDVIKVTDFGLSKDFGRDQLRTSCGTPDYVAPEILRNAPYDNAVDIWSIGVICYILLCGFPPFYGTDQQIFNKILRAEYDFPSPDWDDISDDAKEFISCILVLDPSERPSAEECLNAPWITSKAPKDKINVDTDRFSSYNEQRKKLGLKGAY